MIFNHIPQASLEVSDSLWILSLIWDQNTDKIELFGILILSQTEEKNLILRKIIPNYKGYLIYGPWNS